ncbi:MAG: alpha,alpha-trehalase TreA [Ginsengibacter sp.]
MSQEVKDIFLLGELFTKVQLQPVFEDGKTFVDCTPLSSLSSVLQRYDTEKGKHGFDLKTFILQNFELPGEAGLYTSDALRPIINHLELLWDELTRQPVAVSNSLIPLPFPYIVPGGRFREIYYWDSYFTMLGLQVSGRVELIKNMVDNFSYLIDHIGYIPNGNRSYFLGRSQPPFYACMVQLLSEEIGKNNLVAYLPQLEKEYNFWMKGIKTLGKDCTSVSRVVFLQEGEVLNRYWDESPTPRPESYREDVELAKDASDPELLFRNLRAACESGWDFSSRWFTNQKDFSTIHTTAIIPVDLNCLLLNLETTLAEASRLVGNIAAEEKFIVAADKRKAAINKYCWNESIGCYVDYDHEERRQKESLTLATVYPLFFKIASNEQAAAVSKILKEKFLGSGGLRTTTINTGQQWDSPNGWAPLHWLAVKGLLNYGLDILAKDIAMRWMDANERVYRNTGKMMEKYNVEATNLEAGGGEYPAQDGFGWTNGVYLKLHTLFNLSTKQ